MLRQLTGRELAVELRGKNTAVLGLGKSGISAAKALHKLDANLFLSDSGMRKDFTNKMPRILEKIPSEFGGHSSKILSQDLLIVSPGIHMDIPLLMAARRKGIPIWSELELGWRLGKFKRVAAVTGTNGKTTTTSLLGHILKKNGYRTLVAGNIGNPICDYFDQSDRFDAVVLEVSSYQLEGCHLFRPDAACFLNLTPDHGERHPSMKLYGEAKMRIFMNQTRRDTALVNFDDPWCRKLSKKIPSKVIYFSTRRSLKSGISYDPENSEIVCRGGRTARLPIPANLPGLHNIENACAAAGLAMSLDAKQKAMAESFRTFKGVEHRIEKVRSIRGITFINDSKATNVDSTLKALEALPGPLWLILGGQDKGAPYQPLIPFIRRKVKGILLIGEASKKISRELRNSAPMHDCKTMFRAVQRSFQLATEGDSVLLSPACASFDQFKNFEDRGRQFKNFVGSLG